MSRNMIDPDCYYGDHEWRGGGACVRCGVQLRCYCGQFVTESGIDKHLRESCLSVSPHGRLGIGAAICSLKSERV